MATSERDRFAGLTSIRVPERGASDLDLVTWEELRRQREFQLLLEQGVVTAIHLPDGGVRLRGGCFVGHALCGRFRVELHEKVAGALRALVEHASKEAFRVASLGSQATEIGPLLGLLITQFLGLVGGYATKGRDSAYVREMRTGSLAGGRVHIVRSLNLRARGLGHLLAFESPKITFNTPINRVLASTLREIEKLSWLIEIGSANLSLARGYSLMFSDCSDYQLLSAKREDLAEQAASLAAKSPSRATADMLALARIILSHQSIEPDKFLLSESPRTWFLNLELLFEQSVRELLATKLKVLGREVHNGREHSLPIFGAERKLYKANPDIVITGGAGPRSIGDTKYKELGNPVDAGDVYQLLAHASAFNARHCFLLFPGEKFQVKYLGETGDRRSTWAASLNLLDLENSIQELIASLGLVDSASFAA